MFFEYSKEMELDVGSFQTLCKWKKGDNTVRERSIFYLMGLGMIFG